MRTFSDFVSLREGVDETDFAMGNWPIALDYLHDDPTARKKWFVNWLQDKYWEVDEALGKMTDGAAETDAYFVPDTWQNATWNAHIMWADYVRPSMYDAIDDAMVGGGPNLQTHELWLDRTAEAARNAPAARMLVMAFSDTVREMLKDLSGRQLAARPEGGPKINLANRRWGPD